MVDFRVAFSEVIIIVRRLIREGWRCYRWEGRPSRCPRHIRASSKIHKKTSATSLWCYWSTPSVGRSSLLLKSS